MTESVSIQMTVNGREIKDNVDGELSLLHYLRREMKLTGAKKGCGQAQCGTCTVLINSRPVKSCALQLFAFQL